MTKTKLNKTIEKLNEILDKIKIDKLPSLKDQLKPLEPKIAIINADKDNVEFDG